MSNIWLAVLVGAALARIDAALGAAVMVNPAVPARIRRLINVESGLNDGIATPFVLVAIARRGDCRACRQRRGPGRRGSCLTLRLPAAQRRDLSRDASRHSHAPALPARSCSPGHPPARGSRGADVPGTQATGGPLRRSSRWPRLRKRVRTQVGEADGFTDHPSSTQRGPLDLPSDVTQMRRTWDRPAHIPRGWEPRLLVLPPVLGNLPPSILRTPLPQPAPRSVVAAPPLLTPFE